MSAGKYTELLALDEILQTNRASLGLFALFVFLHGDLLQIGPRQSLLGKSTTLSTQANYLNVGRKAVST